MRRRDGIEIVTIAGVSSIIYYSLLHLFIRSFKEGTTRDEPWHTPLSKLYELCVAE